MTSFPPFIKNLKWWNNIFWSTLFILAFFLLPIPISKGCGPVDLSFQGYSFINPKIIDIKSTLSPFFLNFKEIAEQFKGQEENQTVDNITEWTQRFCEIPDPNDIYSLIYKSSLEDLEGIQESVENPEEELPISFQDNSFAQHLTRYGCTETIDYLVFAKSCEPYAVSNDAWESRERDVEKMRDLVLEGVEAFKEVKSDYIKLRYAYQVIRMAHYAKDYRVVLRLYDDLMPKIDHDPSILEHWILGHKAGALKGLGKRVEAAYLFSKVFLQCSSKRESAFNSFSIRTNKEWEECLLLCKTDQERANIYALRANDKNSKVLEELKMIYELDPKSDELELLLVKEVEKLEKDLLGTSFNDKAAENKRNYNLPRKFAGQYVIELQKFVREVVQQGGVKRPNLWRLAEGYLELLAGDYYQADKTFAQLEDNLDNPELEAQLRTFRLVNRIASLEATEKTIEFAEAFADSIQRSNDVYLQFEDFPDFLSDRMAQIYANIGAPGLSYLNQHNWRDIFTNPQMEIIDDMLELVREEDPNRFERELIKGAEGVKMEQELVSLKVATLLNEYNFNAALAAANQLERADWNDLDRYAVFVERINDCVHCTPTFEGGFDTLLVNRQELAQRLATMESEADAGIGAVDLKYYYIGLALYNTSYFGSEWEARDYFRSGASLRPWKLEDGDFVIEDWQCPMGNLENMDCSKAMYFFEKARSTTEDPELAAKAAFMAAKCEQNLLYVFGGQRTFKYFDLLLTNAQNTAFFNRIINECDTFYAYASQ